MKLLILFTLFGVIFAGVFKHKLIWRESQRIKMMKAGLTPPKINRGNRLNDFPQDANDFRDLEYLANITIGSPEQFFIVQLDTGSADLWIPDLTCDICTEKHQFNSSCSSTYEENGQEWSIQYGKGYSSGYLGEDVVRFVGENGAELEVPNCILGQATTIADIFVTGEFDGILGLAYPSLSEFGAANPLLNAMAQGLLDSPIFTVYLQERGQEDNVPGGVFTYGGLDTEHCGNTVYEYPLTDESHFQFSFESLSIGGFSASSDEWEAISDTGTSFMIGPADIVEGIADAAGANFTNGYYFVDCDAQFDDLKIGIGDYIYTIRHEQLIIKVGNNKCWLALSSGVFNGFNWIFGDPWLRSYCNIYNLASPVIGFAEVIA